MLTKKILMKKFTFNLIVSALLLSSATMLSQELVVKSNLEGLTMSVGETFKPTSFAENLKGEKTMCQAVIYYNKKGVFSSAKSIIFDRSKGTLKANDPGTHEIVAVCINSGGKRLTKTFYVNVNYPKVKEVKQKCFQSKKMGQNKYN